MYDIVVVATNLDEGMSRLKTVMHVVARNSLNINFQNVSSFIDPLDYLRYHICHNIGSPFRREN